MLRHRNSGYVRSLKIAAAVMAVPALIVAVVGITSTSGKQSVTVQSAAAARQAHGPVGDRCSKPGLLFCEDFNELQVGAAVSPNWTDDTQQGTLTVEPLWPGSSTLVLHAHTAGTGRALMSINNFSAPGNSFYGRMWVEVAAFPHAPSFAHFMIVQATGTGNGGMIRPVGGQYVEAQYLKDGGPSRSLWGVGSDGGPTGDWENWRESATAVPGRWQCIQFSMLASTNTVQMSVNGAYNPELVATTNSHGGSNVPFILPQVNKIEIGWWEFHTNPEPLQFDAYFDDIALSSTPIGCGPGPLATGL